MGSVAPAASLSAAIASLPLLRDPAQSSFWRDHGASGSVLADLTRPRRLSVFRLADIVLHCAPLPERGTRSRMRWLFAALCRGKVHHSDFEIHSAASMATAGERTTRRALWVRRPPARRVVLDAGDSSCAGSVCGGTRVSIPRAGHLRRRPPAHRATDERQLCAA